MLDQSGNKADYDSIAAAMESLCKEKSMNDSDGSYCGNQACDTAHDKIEDPGPQRKKLQGSGHSRRILPV